MKRDATQSLVALPAWRALRALRAPLARHALQALYGPHGTYGGFLYEVLRYRQTQRHSETQTHLEIVYDIRSLYVGEMLEKFKTNAYSGIPANPFKKLSSF